jgi:hypothetical protein
LVSPKGQRFRLATRSRSSSSAAALLLVLAALIAGCGGGSSSNQHTHTQRHSGGGTQPAAPEPTGHLSAAEYASIEHEYTLLHPLTKAQDLSHAAAHARTACAVLNYPNTRLVRLVRTDCHDAVAFFAALGAIQTAAGDCQRSDPSATTHCLSQRYHTLGIALQRITASGLDLNSELARRRIIGLCALSIGIRRQDVQALQQASAAALSAAGALASGNSAGFLHWSKQIDKAFGQQDSHDALQGIRQACNPSKRPSSAPRTAPKRKATPKPRPRPRRQQPREIQPGSGLNI